MLCNSRVCGHLSDIDRQITKPTGSKLLRLPLRPFALAGLRRFAFGHFQIGKPLAKPSRSRGRRSDKPCAAPFFSPYETDSSRVNHKCQQPFAILFLATLARSIPATWRGCSSRPAHAAATSRAASSTRGTVVHLGSSCLGGPRASACRCRRCSHTRAAERAPHPGRMQAR